MINKKYIEDEKPMTQEEKVKLTKRGMDAGHIAMGTGLLATGLGTVGEHMPEKYVSKNAAKATKIGGVVTAGTGAAVTGYMAYKHYKYKKKKDDNSEK